MSNIAKKPAALPSEGFAITEGHDNFFTPLRLVFASLVVLGHAYAIALRDASLEPHMLYHYTFSYLAVNLFFIASGFLVTKSMVYRGDTPSFISARVLRIFPALAIHVLFVMFIIGPLATNIAWNDFFSSPDWYLQPLMVLTFFETDMNLPGIFDTNAEQFGSATLWTLRYEVIAYIGTLAVFSLGFLRKKWMVLAQFVLPSIGWIIGTRFGIFEALPGTIENLFRFGIAYGLGAAIYAYRERLNFGWITLAALITASYLLRKTEVLEVVMNAVLCWVIFRVAYMKAPKWAWLQRIPDLSYGIYIYHWCVLQLLFYWFPQLSVMELFALSFPPTVALAALSWYIVEKPMLRNKIKFANWLRGLGFKRPMAKQQYLLD
ncbi:acyltransferase family protein [Litorimonas cladophorae]|nr:acyltransferase [Litorimonas cladophorae]